MRAWFDNLERRERIVLTIGAAVVSLIIAWGFIWTPLRDGAIELGDAVIQKNQMLVTLQRAEALSTTGTAVATGGAAARAAATAKFGDFVQRPLAHPKSGNGSYAAEEDYF